MLNTVQGIFLVNLYLVSNVRFIKGKCQMWGSFFSRQNLKINVPPWASRYEKIYASMLQQTKVLYLAQRYKRIYGLTTEICPSNTLG